MKWKKIKNSGVFDNLPRGEIIAFKHEDNSIFVLRKDYCYDISGFTWMYENTNSEFLNIKDRGLIEYMCIKI